MRSAFIIFSLAEPSVDSAEDEFAKQLLVAADRFQLADLVEACADRLARTLTADNVARRMLFADRHNAPRLLQRCIEFIRANPRQWKSLRRTDEFGSFGPGLDSADKTLLQALSNSAHLKTTS